ncbi:MAG: hypothetical protein JNL40_02315 [Cyclobacteriaceae bacterium]|nr:hypothetical protein [Cyclobacteriaceae bacterium]
MLPSQSPFGQRRAQYTSIGPSSADPSISGKEIERFETFDAIYRSLCAILYNYAPLSGHPGGSISSGRFVNALLYDSLCQDLRDPNRWDADILSYSAGHKALGLYALLSLRNEVMRIAHPVALPKDVSLQLRLEDLLGFRRNPNTSTPLFKKFLSKPLDGHPTPATPFVRLSTGASGVGMGSSLGLSFALADYFGEQSPQVHIIEGEGGLTPGRVTEALAAAGTASLHNTVLHIDWNQASIDSNRVCRDHDQPGDYVQWDPCELTYLHDWNTILVEDGKDFRQVLTAQRMARTITNHQPTAIIYKTVKGWNYGIEGSKSHGAGHALCSAGFHQALEPILKMAGKDIKICGSEQECRAGTNATIVEQCLWDALLVIREVLEKNRDLTNFMADRVMSLGSRLDELKRTKRQDAPDLSKAYERSLGSAMSIPAELTLKPGSSATLRGELGNVLAYYNKVSRGAFLTAAADLLGSTSVNTIGKDFGAGFYNASTNPSSRTLSIGGICEDAMAGIMSGISTPGQHIGVCSSYGAFIVALGHIAARLHAIGNQARQQTSPGPYNPFIIVSAHTGIKTGEDGPTHADPQPLQLIQENFPKGTCVTLTPWDPQELWPLITAALEKRPAVISPFVTRPNEKIIDRTALGLAPATLAAQGVYCLKRSSKHEPDGVIVLQGSEVAYAFVERAMPLLAKDHIDLDVYYVASAELFDLLPEEQQLVIFPERAAAMAMGITGFTLPTLYRWITSAYGREHCLYPFRKGHFLGSGKADAVVAEAGLDGESQYRAIREYVAGLKEVRMKSGELLTHLH